MLKKKRWRKKMRVMFKPLNENAKLPTKAHTDDVGYDLYALEDCILRRGEVSKIRTGIIYGGFDALHHGTTPFMSIFPKIEGRSSLAAKGIFPVGGIVDPGYRGELIVMLYNSNDDSDGYEIVSGDRIAQLVFYMTAQPNVQIGELKKSERGEAGFGSTGK